jgi:lysyl-tRNA synthetase class 2
MTFTTNKELLRFRSHVTQAIRSFFEGRGYLEVDTPIALLAPPPEVHIDPIEVTVGSPRGAETRYLQTSPELPMKRLLCHGSGPIFQIASVFRDNDESERHRSEFRLLEWYNQPFPWETMLVETEALLRHCAQQLRGEHSLQLGEQTISIADPFARITVADACRDYLAIDLLAHLERTTLQTLFKDRGWHFAQDDSWDELFHRLWVGYVEPKLNADYPVYFLTHYPAPLAALARRSSHDSRVAERAECVIGGLELSNGFGELHDPTEQRQRFKEDRQARAKLGKATPPLDEAFLGSVAKLKGAYGNALGLERLMMLLCGATDIQTVLPFQPSSI